MKPETVANVVGALAGAVHSGVVSTGLDATLSAALVHLSKYGDETIESLRRPLTLSHSACVRVVDRLEEGRCLVRREGKDARSLALRLTAKGRSAAQQILERRQQALTAALAVLTRSESEELGRLASKVLGAIVTSEAEALRVCRLCDYALCPDHDCPVAQSLAARPGASA